MTGKSHIIVQLAEWETPYLQSLGFLSHRFSNNDLILNPSDMFIKKDPLSNERVFI